MPALVITRLLHGGSRRKHADEYLDVLLHAGTEEDKRTPGKLSSQVWRSVEEDTCHLWNTMGKPRIDQRLCRRTLRKRQILSRRLRVSP